MMEKNDANPILSRITCWVITEAAIGLQNQAIGLAEALGVPYILKEAQRPKNLWRRFFPEDHDFIPPWPDMVISCGGNSVALSRNIRKASAGKTFTVHIQDPLVHSKNFDAVIVPAHDKLRGDNVLVTQGAVHRVSTDKLMNAANHFRPLLGALSRPLLCALVGGNNRHQNFTASIIRDFSDKLLFAARNSGCGIAITPSRRTGTANEEMLKQSLRGVSAFIWDGQGENPYWGMLALADTLVVTSDSISMISEACSTGKPVYVYDLPGAGKRHKQFLESLSRLGVTRPFSGKIETWKYEPLNDTRNAADFVRERFLEKIRP